MCLRQLIKSKTIVLVKLEFHKFVGELYTVIPSFRVIRFKKNDLENLFMNQEIQNIGELLNSLFVVP